MTGHTAGLPRSGEVLGSSEAGARPAVWRQGQGCGPSAGDGKGQAGETAPCRCPLPPARDRDTPWTPAGRRPHPPLASEESRRSCGPPSGERPGPRQQEPRQPRGREGGRKPAQATASGGEKISPSILKLPF